MAHIFPSGSIEQFVAALVGSIIVLAVWRALEGRPGPRWPGPRWFGSPLVGEGFGDPAEGSFAPGRRAIET